MEGDEPFRRYSLQEPRGQFFVQHVGTRSDPDLACMGPSEYQEISPHINVMHKGNPARRVPRKFSLQEYEPVRRVAQMQQLYTVPYQNGWSACSGLASPRPIQEVQPFGLDRSPPSPGQALQVQAMKRRHLLRSQQGQGYIGQQGQAQGYLPQQLQDAMVLEEPENVILEDPRSQQGHSYVPQLHQDTRSQQGQSQGYMPQQHQGAMFMEQPENFIPENQSSQLIPPPQMQQPGTSMFTFQPVESSQSYGPVDLTSNFVTANSPVESQMTMPVMSPVQMVRPLQKFPPMVPTSNVQLVPMQAMPGSRLGYRSGSLEDEVFVTYQPYLDQDECFYDPDPTQAHYNTISGTRGLESYIGLQRSPQTATRACSSLTSATQIPRMMPTATRECGSSLTSAIQMPRRAPKVHKDLKVSFEDELPKFQRERSYSSPPNMLLKKPEPQCSVLQTPQPQEVAQIKTQPPGADLEPYVALKRVSPKKPSPLADKTNDTKKEEDDKVDDSYVGVRRLPRNRSGAVRSAREKKDEEEDKLGENVAVRVRSIEETSAAGRRTSVPANGRSQSSSSTNTTQKTRRNSFCPMTAYNLRGSSTVAIDNKIEQAMDLVKSHLMFAVREEVEVLKVQISDLIERNNQLEYENGILRAAATPETLAKLAAPRQQPPASSS